MDSGLLASNCCWVGGGELGGHEDAPASDFECMHVVSGVPPVSVSVGVSVFYRLS